MPHAIDPKIDAAISLLATASLRRRVNCFGNMSGRELGGLIFEAPWAYAMKYMYLMREVIFSVLF